MPRDPRAWCSRLARAEIRIYSEGTPAEKLYRHHRLARTLGWLWIAAAALLGSSLVEFMLGRDGWLRTITLVVLLVSTAICFVSFIPGIAAGLWIREIEAAMTSRGLEIPLQGKMLEGKVRKHAFKLAFCLVILIAIGWLAQRGIPRQHR